jgi:hypothetical protein
MNRKVLTNPFDCRYFNGQIELQPGGLRAVAHTAVSYYKATLDGLNLATQQDSTNFDDHTFPSAFPEELTQALEEIFIHADKLAAALQGNDDDELYTVALAGVRAVLKATKPNDSKLAATFDVPEGLNGILYPHMFEITGEYYPGTRASLWL